jgi:hypothetical protein
MQSTKRTLAVLASLGLLTLYLVRTTRQSPDPGGEDA